MEILNLAVIVNFKNLNIAFNLKSFLWSKKFQLFINFNLY